MAAPGEFCASGSQHIHIPAKHLNIYEQAFFCKQTAHCPFSIPDLAHLGTRLIAQQE
jgi:hypothetical protein